MNVWSYTLTPQFVFHGMVLKAQKPYLSCDSLFMPIFCAGSVEVVALFIKR
jgi:hypothetical protein